MMLTAVRRLCGQPETGPRGEDDQSKERIIAPISPPPARQSRLSRAAVRELTARTLVNPESGRGMAESFLQEQTIEVPQPVLRMPHEASQNESSGRGQAANPIKVKQKSRRWDGPLNAVNAAAAARTVRSR